MRKDVAHVERRRNLRRPGNILQRNESGGVVQIAPGRWVESRKFSRNYLRDAVFVRIADHPCNSVELSDFRRSALRIASRNQNPGLGLAAPNAANRGASIVIGGGCNCAGVENHQLGLFRVPDAPHSHTGELALDGRAICLRSTTSEVLNVVTAHGVIITVVECGSRLSVARDSLTTHFMVRRISASLDCISELPGRLAG